MDAHDTGAMACVDAMPKRQEAIPALRRRLGPHGWRSRQAQPCSSGGAGQGCSATIRPGAGRPASLLEAARDVGAAILNARYRASRRR